MRGAMVWVVGVFMAGLAAGGGGAAFSSVREADQMIGTIVAMAGTIDELRKENENCLK
jgi:hypothetical protein